MKSLHPYGEELSYLSRLGRFGMKLGLERIQGLLDRLDKPQEAFRSVLIAGTNGKGSTAAMIASILQASGRRVGLYTSPHLREERERVQVNGEHISSEKLGRLIRDIRVLVGENRTGREEVTYFEFLTALAFHYFRAEEVDLAVLETGLGGRLDATNTVNPLVSVITSIELDHTEHLGKEVLAISREKAGILRPGKMAVVSRQRPEVSSFLAESCRAGETDLRLYGRDFHGEVLRSSLEGLHLNFFSPAWSYRDLELPLLGRHQGDNAAAALAACCCLKEQGMVLEEGAIRQGLAKVRWPGRLEVVATNPMILLDGAHNPAAALALRQALEELFPTQGKFIIFGVLRDKEYSKMVASLAPLAKEMIFVRLQAERGADPAQVAREALNRGGKALVLENLPRALDYARERASLEDIICVTGSLYTVGEAMEALEVVREGRVISLAGL